MKNEAAAEVPARAASHSRCGGYVEAVLDNGGPFVSPDRRACCSTGEKHTGEKKAETISIAIGPLFSPKALASAAVEGKGKTRLGTATSARRAAHSLDGELRKVTAKAEFALFSLLSSPCFFSLPLSLPFLPRSPLSKRSARSHNVFLCSDAARVPLAATVALCGSFPCPIRQRSPLFTPRSTAAVNKRR